jgi:glycosyltransferase involved in cell wall biosynthesis
VDVSVVIPVRDGAESIGPLLDSLARQTLSRDRFEVIVVDNDSRDDTAAVARERGATVVSEPIANRSRARNTGRTAASADLIAFTDADCVADERWLEALLASAGVAPLVAGDVVVSTNDPPNRIERFEALWRFGQESWVREQGWAATANLLVRKEAFDAIQGFDPTWRHIGEDVDFCLRAAAAGFDLGWCGDAVVSHFAESRLKPMLRRSFLHGYSVNQAHYRLGRGFRAWRHPRAALSARAALDRTGIAANRIEPGERRAIEGLARASYAARIAGSAWAELRRAR